MSTLTLLDYYLSNDICQKLLVNNNEDSLHGSDCVVGNEQHALVESKAYYHHQQKVITIIYSALDYPDARVRDNISTTIQILYGTLSIDLLNAHGYPDGHPITHLIRLHSYIVERIQYHWCRSITMRPTQLGDETEIAMD